MHAPVHTSNLKWTGIKRTLFISIGLAAVIGGLYFADRSGGDPEVYGNDFNVYYHASREVIAGRDPYQNSLSEWTPYLYPPLLAELTIPLALLPLSAAAYIWFLMSAFSVIATAAMCARMLPETSVPRWLVAAGAMVIVFRFVLDNFNLGQVNAIVTALAVAHVFSYARGKKFWSALALAIAVSIKLTPAILLVYHIAKLRLRYAIACIVLVGAITALSFLPMGTAAPGAFGEFVNRTLRNEQGYNLADSGNQSLRGALARLTTTSTDVTRDNGDSRIVFSGMTVLLSIIVLAAAVWGATRARNEMLAVAPFFCCVVLLSPLSWKAHFVMLVLPLVQLGGAMLNASRTERRLIAATLVAALVLFNLTSPRVIGLAAAEWSDAHSLVFAGGLLVFIASVGTALMQSLASNAAFANLNTQRDGFK
jgi:alpha-1,2-mannosyltransferase